MTAQEFKPNNAATGHKVAAFIREGDAGDPGSCRASYDPVTKTLRVHRADGREEILENLTPSDIDDIEEIMAGGAPPIPEYEVRADGRASPEHYGLTALLYLLIEAQGTARLEELVSMIERRREQYRVDIPFLSEEERIERYYRFSDSDLGRVAEKFAVRLLAARLPEVAPAPTTKQLLEDMGFKAAPFDPQFNCPSHFAGGDPTCPACLSKQPKPLVTCTCGAEFGAGHEPDCPAVSP